MEKIEFVNNTKDNLFASILQKKPNISFGMLKASLRKKDIKVNGKRVKENIPIKQGDVVTVFLPNKIEKNVPIIYEDKNIIIVNKPQGMEVTKKDKTYMEDVCLEEVIKAKACHRLDRNTSGLVVLAKSDEVFNLIKEVFQEHKISKHYMAIVTGKMKSEGESLVNYLEKFNNYVKVYDEKIGSSKIAKMSYVVKQSEGGVSLLDITLETGRTHQIRAQLAHHGIFIIGDEKYGNKEINKKYHKSKQLLCAYKIAFSDMPLKLSNLSNKTFIINPEFSVGTLIEKK